MYIYHNSFRFWKENETSFHVIFSLSCRYLCFLENHSFSWLLIVEFDICNNIFFFRGRMHVVLLRDLQREKPQTCMGLQVEFSET